MDLALRARLTATGCLEAFVVDHRSVKQFVEIVHNQIRSMLPKLLGIPLARDADHKPEMPVGPRLDP